MRRFGEVRTAIGRAVRMSTRVPIAAICAVALWCGGPAPAFAAPEQGPVVVGDASAILAGVDVRGGEAPYVPLAAVTPVAVGDGVRTDDTGYAEIAYVDGSRTRLDVDTEFEVVELVDDAGVSSTRTSMGAGRTWHRVESLGEGEEFSVETSQATATVRGTAFAIDCLAVRCTYLVVSGTIELILADGSVLLVVGPAEVAVIGGIPGLITPVAADRVFGDPWLADNVSRDIAAGFADLAATFLGSAATTTTVDTGTEPPPESTTTTEPQPTTTTTSTEPPTTTTELPTTSPEPPPSTTTGPATPTTAPTTTTPTTALTTTTTTTALTTTTTTEAPNETTSTTPTTTSTTTSTTTTSTTTSTTTTSTTSTSTTTTTTTTTTTPREQVAICHWVEGGGNEGSGYVYLELGAGGLAEHRKHPLDRDPDPNSGCSLPNAAELAQASLPPSTTTTTTPAVETRAAAPVIEAAAAAQPVSTAMVESQPPASTQSPATGPAPEPSSPPSGPEPDESSPSGGAPAGWGGRVFLDPRVGR